MLRSSPLNDDHMVRIKYRDRELNSGLRGEGPASCPLDHRGMEEAAVLSSHLSYGELRVDGRGRTCTLRFRRPASSPFDYVDKVLLHGTWCAPWVSNPVSSGVRARFPTSQE